jgi:hypothetical protein
MGLGDTERYAYVGTVIGGVCALVAGMAANMLVESSRIRATAMDASVACVFDFLITDFSNIFVFFSYQFMERSFLVMSIYNIAIVASTRQ